MSKVHPVGTLEHALAHAVQSLGVDTVAGICNRSPSAIYRGINPDDPLKLSWLTVDHISAMGEALLGRGKPEFFSTAIRQGMEDGAFAQGYGLETLESPTLMLAEAAEQVSRALRLAAAAGSVKQADSLHREQALMIVEALESAMSYGKRAKIAILRLTREETPGKKTTGAADKKSSDRGDMPDD
jgi:hypothetical protein